ncbi:hypothetical protein [Phreatobacter sp.]|uniref:hypothetical protein n=1 Tax=Phreatobacter sp. TaxID=1966341 RepID=UPI0025F35B72|nr:hypothetical protein [Phreatobacter sp.]
MVVSASRPASEASGGSSSRGFRKASRAEAAGLPIPASELWRLTEGQQTTAGAYRKAWR